MSLTICDNIQRKPLVPELGGSDVQNQFNVLQAELIHGSPG